MTLTRMLVTVPQAKGQIVSLNRPSMTIGRASGNDVVVGSVDAEEQHARLWIDDTTVRLQDLGSQSGLYVNGRSTRGCVLNNLDLIEIGGCMLRFLTSSAPAPLPRAA